MCASYADPDKSGNGPPVQYACEVATPPGVHSWQELYSISHPSRGTQLARTTVFATPPGVHTTHYTVHSWQELYSISHPSRGTQLARTTVLATPPGVHSWQELLYTVFATPSGVHSWQELYSICHPFRGTHLARTAVLAKRQELFVQYCSLFFYDICIFGGRDIFIYRIGNSLPDFSFSLGQICWPINPPYFPNSV